VHVLRNIHGLACWYVDSRIPLQAAHFRFRHRRMPMVYPDAVPGPVKHLPCADAGRAAVLTPLPGPAVAPRRRALRQMLQRALPLTVLQYRRDRLLVQRVRQAAGLRAPAPLQTHSAEALAALLARVAAHPAPAAQGRRRPRCRA
jgi:hypothetical protein